LTGVTFTTCICLFTEIHQGYFTIAAVDVCVADVLDSVSGGGQVGCVCVVVYFVVVIVYFIHSIIFNTILFHIIYKIERLKR